MLNPLGTRPPVEATKRRRITLKRKRAAHAMAGGLCGCGCGTVVPLSGPGVDYDHGVAVWLGGADDDGPNLRPWVPGHHDIKTYTQDIPRIAKTKRQQKLTEPKVKSKTPLKGRSSWPKGRKLEGRPFPKGKRAMPSRRKRP